jgi:hypothetical protein
MQVINGYADLELTLTYFILAKLEGSVNTLKRDYAELNLTDQDWYSEDFESYFLNTDFGSYIDESGNKIKINNIPDLENLLIAKGKGIYRIKKLFMTYLSAQEYTLESKIHWVKQNIKGREDSSIFIQCLNTLKKEIKDRSEELFPLLPEELLDLELGGYRRFFSWMNLVYLTNSTEVKNEKMEQEIMDIEDLICNFINTQSKVFTEWFLRDISSLVKNSKKLVESFK